LRFTFFFFFFLSFLIPIPDYTVGFTVWFSSSLDSGFSPDFYVYVLFYVHVCYYYVLILRWSDPFYTVYVRFFCVLIHCLRFDFVLRLSCLFYVCSTVICCVLHFAGASVYVDRSPVPRFTFSFVPLRFDYLPRSSDFVHVHFFFFLFVTFCVPTLRSVLHYLDFAFPTDSSLRLHVFYRIVTYVFVLDLGCSRYRLRFRLRFLFRFFFFFTLYVRFFLRYYTAVLIVWVTVPGSSFEFPFFCGIARLSFGHTRSRSHSSVVAISFYVVCSDFFFFFFFGCSFCVRFFPLRSPFLRICWFTLLRLRSHSTSSHHPPTVWDFSIPRSLRFFFCSIVVHVVLRYRFRFVVLRFDFTFWFRFLQFDCSIHVTLHSWFLILRFVLVFLFLHTRSLHTYSTFCWFRFYVVTFCYFEFRFCCYVCSLHTLLLLLFTSFVIVVCCCSFVVACCSILSFIPVFCLFVVNIHCWSVYVCFVTIFRLHVVLHFVAFFWNHSIWWLHSLTLLMICWKIHSLTVPFCSRFGVLHSFLLHSNFIVCCYIFVPFLQCYSDFISYVYVCVTFVTFVFSFYILRCWWSGVQLRFCSPRLFDFRLTLILFVALIRYVVAICVYVLHSFAFVTFVTLLNSFVCSRSTYRFALFSFVLRSVFTILRSFYVCSSVFVTFTLFVVLRSRWKGICSVCSVIPVVLFSSIRFDLNSVFVVDSFTLFVLVPHVPIRFTFFVGTFVTLIQSYRCTFCTRVRFDLHFVTFNFCVPVCTLQWSFIVTISFEFVRSFCVTVTYVVDFAFYVRSIRLFCVLFRFAVCVTFVTFTVSRFCVYVDFFSFFDLISFCVLRWSFGFWFSPRFFAVVAFHRIVTYVTVRSDPCALFGSPHVRTFICVCCSRSHVLHHSGEFSRSHVCSQCFDFIRFSFFVSRCSLHSACI